MADEPRIVEAVATSSGRAGQGADKELSKRVEAAMSQAVHDALADGVTMDDVDEMKTRMMTARQAVLDSIRARAD